MILGETLLVGPPVLWCDEDDDAGEDREGGAEYHKKTEGKPGTIACDKKEKWKVKVTSNTF